MRTKKQLVTSCPNLFGSSIDELDTKIDLIILRKLTKIHQNQHAMYESSWLKIQDLTCVSSKSGFKIVVPKKKGWRRMQAEHDGVSISGASSLQHLQQDLVARQMEKNGVTATESLN